MDRNPRNSPPPPAKTGDAVFDALEALKAYAEILRPQDVDEPILAPNVAHAIFEWLIELRSVDALAAVKVQPRRLALLYGPPGTGKTTLAHHLAARLGLPLVAVRSERLIGSLLGQSAHAVGRLFDLLQPLQGKCVVLLDEFDSLATKRGGDTQGVTRELDNTLNVLLQRIEAFRGVGLAATNTKDTIDPAMWRRFGLQLSVDLPGPEQRFAIIRKYVMPYDLDDASIDILVNVTRDCSPSLLRQLMEGMKRSIVLGPRLKVDVSRPEVVFARVAASIAPPPEMQQPPLWANPEAIDQLQAMAWPPTLTGGAAK